MLRASCWVLRGLAFLVSVAFGLLLWAGATSVCTMTITKMHILAMQRDLDSLANDPHYFRQTTGVRLTIDSMGAKGWRATATHTRVPNVRCSIERGRQPTCEIPISWADRHLTPKRAFHIYVELWLLAATVIARRRRSTVRALLPA